MAQRLGTCVHWWVVALDVEDVSITDRLTSLVIGDAVIVECARGSSQSARFGSAAVHMDERVELMRQTFDSPYKANHIGSNAQHSAMGNESATNSETRTQSRCQPSGSRQMRLPRW